MNNTGIILRHESVQDSFVSCDEANQSAIRRAKLLMDAECFYFVEEGTPNVRAKLKGGLDMHVAYCDSIEEAHVLTALLNLFVMRRNNN